MASQDTALDAPKTLASKAECAVRHALRSQRHIESLARLVERMRKAKGSDYKIPDFDPLDGGIDAQVLFLLEAPGRQAVTSGFVSRNNPDETAKNFYLLNAEAGIERRRTVTWNAVPWYIGSETKVRPARRDDVRAADEWLVEVLETLNRLRFVVFVGQKAWHAQHVVRDARPGVEVMAMPHPSPMFINRASGNRSRVLGVLQDLSARIAAIDA